MRLLAKSTTLVRDLTWVCSLASLAALGRTVPVVLPNKHCWLAITTLLRSDAAPADVFTGGLRWHRWLRCGV